MHQPTNWRPVFFCFCFCPRDLTEITIWKNTKATIACLKKRKKKKAGFQFFGTCGVNTRLNFQIENRKIDREIAEMPFSPFFAENTWLIYGIEFWSYLLMGGELGNETSKYIDVFQSSALSPPISPWSGTTIFIRILYGKVDAFQVARVSRRDRVGKNNTWYRYLRFFHVLFFCERAMLCQGQRFQTSRPNSYKRWR